MQRRRVEKHLLDSVSRPEDPLRHAPEVDPADSVRTRRAVIEVEAVDVDGGRYTGHVFPLGMVSDQD